METKIALIGIVVEDLNSSVKVNDLLHEYSKWIVGRMGIPYRDRGVSVISVVLDAPADEINTLSGKLGKIDGISVRALQTKV